VRYGIYMSLGGKGLTLQTVDTFEQEGCSLLICEAYAAPILCPEDGSTRFLRR
jgi:hypothetical protein